MTKVYVVVEQFGDNVEIISIHKTEKGAKDVCDENNDDDVEDDFNTYVDEWELKE